MSKRTRRDHFLLDGRTRGPCCSWRSHCGGRTADEGSRSEELQGIGSATWRVPSGRFRSAARPSARAGRSSRTACRRISSPHGRGSRVWDVDGNEYIDFVNGLASVTLGYNDPDVNAAVRAPARARRHLLASAPARSGGRRADLRDGARAPRWCASARTAPTPPPARSGLRAPSPSAIASPSAAITAGRTGTSARPRAIAACRRRPAS